MKTVAINGTLREELGKKGAGSVRREERVPCVMYGGDKVIHFSTTIGDLRHLVYTPDFKTAEVTVDGKSYRAILKDVQFHPVTDSVIHADFLQLIDGHPIKVELPVRFKGVSPGVKSGGKLLAQLRRVLVKTTPEKLVEELLVDISKLGLGQSIRIRDIKALDGLEVLMSPSVPVAMVEIPRALRSVTLGEEEEGGEEGAEEGASEE
ncbi:MAG: 50S ribosomal protein L25 [Saprospirales bacterium]|nr:50S ribosomal protein L25 [Saprospirales bacterium]MBK8489552.1 50S ribosomal protein L25 [Saprospirales bacterium]